VRSVLTRVKEKLRRRLSKLKPVPRVRKPPATEFLGDGYVPPRPLGESRRPKVQSNGDQFDNIVYGSDQPGPRPGAGAVDTVEQFVRRKSKRALPVPQQQQAVTPQAGDVGGLAPNSSVASREQDRETRLKYAYKCGSYFGGCIKCCPREERLVKRMKWRTPDGNVVTVDREFYPTGHDVWKSYDPYKTKWLFWCRTCGATDAECWKNFEEESLKRIKHRLKTDLTVTDTGEGQTVSLKY
jgi:hypothetical protein